MITGEMVATIFKYGGISAAIVVGLYAILLGLLATSTFQTHVVYLHKIQMTWLKDLTVPESFGFMRKKVTPFFLESSDGEKLYAWHILPVELYRRHEAALQQEPVAVVSDITSRHAFRLLRDDPSSRLILHSHGAKRQVLIKVNVPRPKDS